MKQDKEMNCPICNEKMMVMIVPNLICRSMIKYLGYNNVIFDHTVSYNPTTLLWKINGTFYTEEELEHYLKLKAFW